MKLSTIPHSLYLRWTLLSICSLISDSLMKTTLQVKHLFFLIYWRFHIDFTGSFSAGRSLQELWPYVNVHARCPRVRLQKKTHRLMFQSTNPPNSTRVNECNLIGSFKSCRNRVCHIKNRGNLLQDYPSGFDQVLLWKCRNENSFVPKLIQKLKFHVGEA